MASLLDLGIDPEILAKVKSLNQPSEEERRTARNYALMNAGFGMMANNQGRSQSQALFNALGAGGAAGLQSYQNTINDAQKDQGQSLQMAMALSKMKKEQEQLQRQNAFIDSLSGGASAGSEQPGQQAGIPPSVNGRAVAADYAFNGGKNIGAWLNDASKPDMQVANGYAYDKRNLKPGYLPAMNVSNNGQASLTKIGPDGLPVVSAPTGALNTYGAYKMLDEGAKAGWDTQTITPQGGNPTLTTRAKVVNQINGTDPAMRVSPQVQTGRDGDRKEIIRQELQQFPNDPALRKEAQGLGIVLQSDAEKARQGGVVEVDKKAAENASSQAAGQQNILNTIDQIDARLKDKSLVLGNSPADRGKMLAHEYGMQSKASINTQRIRELGQNLVLARGSLGAGVSSADAVRYDAAAGRFADPKSYDDMVDAVKTMREIAGTYLKQSDEARSVLETGRKSAVSPGGWSAIRK